MKKLSLFPFLTLTVFGMSSCASGTDDRASLEYEKYRLPNGLEVVLHQDTSDPVVSVAIQYHVGSNREKPGKTGFAHFSSICFSSVPRTCRATPFSRK